MREIQKQQLQPVDLAIADVEFNKKSRDDIPKILLGLKYLYTDRKEELFDILEKEFYPHKNHAAYSSALDAWRILVLGVLKKRLGCDFARLHYFANQFTTLRTMLGHAEFEDNTYYEYETLVEDVNLLTEELLLTVDQWMIQGGFKPSRRKA